MLQQPKPVKLPRRVRREIGRLFDDGAGRYTVFERSESLDVFSSDGMHVLSVAAGDGHLLFTSFCEYLGEQNLGYGILYFADTHEHVRLYPSGRFEVIDLPPDPSPLVDLGSRVVTKREALAVGAGAQPNSQVNSEPAPVLAGASPDLPIEIQDAGQDPDSAGIEVTVSEIEAAENEDTGEQGEVEPVTAEITLPPTFGPVADIEAQAAEQVAAERHAAEVEQARLAQEHADELARVVDSHNQQVATLEAEMMARLREFESASTQQTNEQVQGLLDRLADLEAQLHAAEREQQQAQSEFQAVVAAPPADPAETTSGNKQRRSRTLAAVMAGSLLVAGASGGGYYLLNQGEPVGKHVRVHENARAQALLSLQTLDVIRGELSELIDSTDQVLEAYKAGTDVTVEFRLAIETARETLTSTSLTDLESAIQSLSADIEAYQLTTRIEQATELLESANKSIETAGTRVRSDDVIPATQAGIEALEQAVSSGDLADIEAGITKLREAQKDLDASHAQWHKVNEANQKARKEREEAAARQQQNTGPSSNTNNSSGSSRPSGSTGGSSGGSSGGSTPAPAPTPAPAGRVTGISGSGSASSSSPGTASFSVSVTSSGQANTSVTVSIGGKSTTLGSGTVNGSRTFSGSISGLAPGTYTWTTTAGGISFTGSSITVY